MSSKIEDRTVTAHDSNTKNKKQYNNISRSVLLLDQERYLNDVELSKKLNADLQNYCLNGWASIEISNEDKVPTKVSKLRQWMRLEVYDSAIHSNLPHVRLVPDNDPRINEVFDKIKSQILNLIDIDDEVLSLFINGIKTDSDSHCIVNRRQIILDSEYAINSWRNLIRLSVVKSYAPYTEQKPLEELNSISVSPASFMAASRWNLRDGKYKLDGDTNRLFHEIISKFPSESENMYLDCINRSAFNNAFSVSYFKFADNVETKKYAINIDNDEYERFSVYLSDNILKNLDVDNILPADINREDKQIFLSDYKTYLSNDDADGFLDKYNTSHYIHMR